MQDLAYHSLTLDLFPMLTSFAFPACVVLETMFHAVYQECLLSFYFLRIYYLIAV